MSKIKAFVKKETVLTVSGILAVISMFIVPPSAGYIEYIDFRTLSLLFCLMTVMAGFSGLGIFSRLADALLRLTGTVRNIAIVLILLCFFSSMLFTNDVALITFVPFTIETLDRAGRKKDIILTVVLQTAAANLGSMLTPIGNPQNLYLYGLANINMTEFISLMLPYTLLSLVMVLVICPVFPRTRARYSPARQTDAPDTLRTSVYICLFALSLLTVAHVLDYKILLVTVLTAALLTDRRVFLRVDYSLLITFVFFFVFIGNIGNIGAFYAWMKSVIGGREMAVAILASQCMSNVPAAVLLSGFTDNIKALIVGTNLGGLGTLIASMASLISFKYIAVYDNKIKGGYFVLFTVINAAMLAALCIMSAII